MVRTLSAAVALVSMASVSVLGCSSTDDGPATVAPEGTAGSGGSAGSAGSVGSGGSADLGGGSGSGGSSGSGGGVAGAGGNPDAKDAMTTDSTPEGSDASTDAAKAEGGAGCAAYQLCDDFEGVAPGAAGSPWTTIKSGGYVIETVTTQAHSGMHSVHAMATAGAGYGYIQETKTFPATDFWGRAFMRFQAPSGGHQVFVGLDTNMNEAQGDQVRLLNNLGGGKIATNRRSDDKSKNSNTSIPMGSWFCYEWHETPTEVHIYLDGKELTDVGEMWVEPTLVALVLGFERFSGGMPGDVWIDDVAINSTQIGCN